MIDMQSIAPHDQALAQVPAALRSVFHRVTRCFRISSDMAQGLILAGGELALSPDEAVAHGTATISATGTGLTLPDALTACLGEAAELLSQFAQPGDVALTFARTDLVAQRDVCADGWIGAALATVPNATPLAWTKALTEPDARPVLMPSDVCFRRDPKHRVLEPIGALSSGCAAGAAPEAAKLRAVLELIERDAAALWWHGGRPPHRVEPQVQAAGNALLATLRQGYALRATVFLDLTTDLGVPVMAAVSTDPDGRGLACGLGCRLNPVEALAAAIRELCQMELSAPMAMMKLESLGEAALNSSDRRHLQRAAFDAGQCPLLVPPDNVRQSAVLPPPKDWLTLIDRLRHHGKTVCTLNLTRPAIGVPAVRALSPNLQPFVPEPLTTRMTKTSEIHGGGAKHTGGIPLL